MIRTIDHDDGSVVVVIPVEMELPLHHLIHHIINYNRLWPESRSPFLLQEGVSECVVRERERERERENERTK